MFEVKTGDRVAYSAAWLRSIGCYSGDLPALRGEVLKVQPLGRQQLATVQWAGEDQPAKVLVTNLALVGPNARFCQC